eukprot:COSAG01_NODE_1142_length_11533_cov_9.907381_22_plen_49_part_00
MARLQGSQAFHEMVKGIVREMGMGIVRETFTQTIRPSKALPMRYCHQT